MFKISIQGMGMATQSVDGAVGREATGGAGLGQEGCYYPQDAENFDCVRLSSSHCRINLISLSGITETEKIT